MCKVWILEFGDFGFWILGILDFGFWILGILDFGFWGSWILDFGLGILDGHLVTKFWMLHKKRRLCTPNRVGGFRPLERVFWHFLTRYELGNLFAQKMRWQKKNCRKSSLQNKGAFQTIIFSIRWFSEHPVASQCSIHSPSEVPLDAGELRDFRWPPTAVEARKPRIGSLEDCWTQGLDSQEMIVRRYEIWTLDVHWM